MRRRNGWVTAPQFCPVEKIVVDEGRHMDQFDGGRCRYQCTGPSVPQGGAAKDKERAQALAPGRERFPGRPGEAASAARDDFGQPSFAGTEVSPVLAQRDCMLCEKCCYGDTLPQWIAIVAPM